MNASERERLVSEGTLTIPEACRLSGLGRTYLYSLMEKRELMYVKCGKRRLIPRKELQRFLADGLVTT